MEQKEKLGSRLGFILISAGCAIGIGNVWKFPYMVGENGGGAFVLIYLFFLAVLGIPLMTMEFSVGRASGSSPLVAFKKLEQPGKKWHLHGFWGMAGNYILMMFYTTVTGWMLHYFYLTAKGEFVGKDVAQVGEVFGGVLASPGTMAFWMIIVVVLGFLVCSFGIQKGLERITKWMMLALLGIIVILAINSMTLEGAKEGLKFYLVPDFQKMKEVGIGNVIVGAMNQSFFTLSIGIGSMAIFGSYIGKERSLFGESIQIAVLDTFVAIVSGLIIFPACFTYNVHPDSGPNLIFVTLPNIFNQMPGGRIWGSLFFIFMSFAAFSTILAVFENIMSCFRELTGTSRRTAALINTGLVILLSLPCVFGFNKLSGFQPLGQGSCVLDLEDFIVSNVALPLGSLVYLLFCVLPQGWGWKNFMEEANTGKGAKFPKWSKIYITYILPLMILAIFGVGIYNTVLKIIG